MCQQDQRSGLTTSCWLVLAPWWISGHDANKTCGWIILPKTIPGCLKDAPNQLSLNPLENSMLCSIARPNLVKNISELTKSLWLLSYATHFSPHLLLLPSAWALVPQWASAAKVMPWSNSGVIPKCQTWSHVSEHVENHVPNISVYHGISHSIYIYIYILVA